MRNRYGLALSVLVLSAGAALAQDQKPPAAPSAVPVGVVTVSKQPVAETVRFVGRIEAVERVDIQARVTGYLEDILFKDGDTVKKGQPLYRIEQGPFEAAVQEAQAGVLRSSGQLDNATGQRKRAEVLVKTSATSQAVLDDRIAAEKTAQGDLAASEADLTTAKINLGYTEITSPIDGRIGRTAVTRGNVVSPSSGVLATIVSVDPMYVTFPVSQREFLQLAEKKGSSANKNDFSVQVQFSDGTVYPEPGKINFVDVKVDRATDTIEVRATLANPKHVLVDGQLVQVTVEGDKPEEKVLVPQTALIADQEGVYVFAVENGKAVVKRLKLGQAKAGSIAVEQGLNGGEQVVVQGAASLRPGAPVLATPVSVGLGGH